MAVSPLLDRLYVLALDERRGTVRISCRATLAIGLAGAALLELLLSNRITASGAELTAAGAGTSGDALLDESLSWIAGQGPTDARRLVDGLSKPAGRWPGRIADRLTAAGVARQETRSVLGPLGRREVVFVDARLRADVVQTVRSVALTGAGSPADLALGTIAQATGALTPYLGREERRGAADRLRALANGDLVAGSVRESVRAAEAAMAGAIAASIAASVAASAATTAATSSA